MPNSPWNSCDYCEGTGLIDTSDPSGTMRQKDLARCEFCQGTGRIFCDVCKQNESIMHAWVVVEDEAHTHYLCRRCAHKAMAEDRLLRVVDSSIAEAGLRDQPGNEARSLLFRVMAGGFRAQVCGTIGRSPKPGAVVRLSIGEEAVAANVSLSPEVAVAIGSRLIASANFTASIPSQAHETI